MTGLRAVARSHLFDAVVVLSAVVTAADVATRSAPWLAVVSGGSWLPLLGRGRRPFAAPATVWLVGAGIALADGRVVVAAAGLTVAGLAAAFLLGQLPDGRTRWAGLGVVLAGSLLIVARGPGHPPSDLLFVPVPFAVAWLAGGVLGERTARAEAAARLAVAEERGRIAREMHDVVAHAVSVMVLHTGAVRHTLPGGLEEQRSALEGVEATGRRALAEMRRLLGALREGGAELAPQPGLRDLEALVAEVARAGLPVRLRVEGEPPSLPDTLDLSAYRIVQEGLTNALRHAHASRAEVVVAYAPDALRIDVRDDGTGGSVTGGGHGLLGVRERVKVYGGTVSAGPAPDGGFLLSARIPV
ncbi:sensor histidine kinase [Geodermatophilus sp. URMC 63]